MPSIIRLGLHLWLGRIAAIGCAFTVQLVLLLRVLLLRVRHHGLLHPQLSLLLHLMLHSDFYATGVNHQLKVAEYFRLMPADVTFDGWVK